MSDSEYCPLCGVQLDDAPGPVVHGKCPVHGVIGRLRGEGGPVPDGLLGHETGAGLAEQGAFDETLVFGGVAWRRVDELDVLDPESEEMHRFELREPVDSYRSRQKQLRYPDGTVLDDQGMAHEGGVAVFTVQGLTPGHDMLIIGRTDVMYVEGELILRVEGRDPVVFPDFAADRRYRWRNRVIPIPGEWVEGSTLTLSLGRVDSTKDLSHFRYWIYQCERPVPGGEAGGEAKGEFEGDVPFEPGAEPSVDAVVEVRVAARIERAAEAAVHAIDDESIDESVDLPVGSESARVAPARSPQALGDLIDDPTTVPLGLRASAGMASILEHAVRGDGPFAGAGSGMGAGSGAGAGSGLTPPAGWPSGVGGPDLLGLIAAMEASEARATDPLRATDAPRPVQPSRPVEPARPVQPSRPPMPSLLESSLREPSRRVEASRPEASRPESSRPEPSRLEPSRPVEPSRPEPSRPEPSRPEPSQSETSPPGEPSPRIISEPTAAEPARVMSPPRPVHPDPGPHPDPAPSASATSATQRLLTITLRDDDARNGEVHEHLAAEMAAGWRIARLECVPHPTGGWLMVLLEK